MRNGRPRLFFAFQFARPQFASKKPSKISNVERFQSLSKSMATIDLTQDSDDEDLRKAIELSLQVPHPISCPQAKNSCGDGFSGLDRKQMERDRLDRLKRKRHDGCAHLRPKNHVSQHLNNSSKCTAQGDKSKTVLSGPEAASTPSLVRIGTPQDTSMPKSDHESNGRVQLKYEGGTVKKTWAFGYPRDGFDIKIEEILDKHELEAAVLSSFMWDFDWLFPKLDTKRTKLVLVFHAKERRTREQYIEDFSGIPNVRLCFPAMEGQVNCMHSKLMLLFYKEFVRIVVPTANLVAFDWGEAGGIMENMVFIIDLPSSASSSQSDGPLDVKGQRKTTSGDVFRQSLMAFLTSSNMPPDVINRLHDFNFASTEHLGFVHSIGGSHIGKDLMGTGVVGLAKTVSDLHLASTEPIELDIVSSSVGSLNVKFLRSMYLACQGSFELIVDGSDDDIGRKQRKQRDPFPEMQDEQEFLQHIRCYYPSRGTVEAAKGGRHAAGTICFQEKWWNNTEFPKSVMRDCISRRNGLLMHNKVFTPCTNGFDMSQPNACAVDVRALSGKVEAFGRIGRKASGVGVHWQCQSLRKCLVSRVSNDQ